MTRKWCRSECNEEFFIDIRKIKLIIKLRSEKVKVKGFKVLKELKGFMAVLMAIALILSILSVQDFSMDVHAAGKEIPSIDITYKEPKVGDDIDEFIHERGYYKVPEYSKYYVARVEVRTVDGDNTEIVDDGKFEKRQYEIRFIIYMDDGYYFNMYNLKNALINGYESNGSQWYDSNLENLMIRYTPEAQNIKKFNMIVPDPVVGETPVNEPIMDVEPSDAITSDMYVQWYEFSEDIGSYDFLYKFDNNEIKPMKEGEVFKEGKYYYWMFDPRRMGYTINEKYNAKFNSSNQMINGKSANDYYYLYGYISCYLNNCGLPIIKHNVSFEANGGSAVAAQRIEKGKVAVKPADPSRAGYSFGGWYTDNSFGTAYDFGKAVTSDITLYAKWNKNPEKNDTTNSNKKYKNEWVDGKWYNSQGVSDYDGVLEWKCNSTGWWVEDSKGWYPVSQWQKIDGKWYYFTESGYMDYSEYRDGYWLGADGAMVDGYHGEWKSDATGWWFEDTSGWYPQNKWLWINGKCYYFGGDGYLLTNQYVDGCWVGADGAWS